MSKVKETLAKCHFSVTTFNQTLLFTALPQTTLRALGKSCYIAETTDGFIAYPRVEEDGYPGDTIVVKSSYFGYNSSFHEYFIIKIGWKNGSPEVAEVANSCTNDKQLFIAISGHLTIRVGDIAYTTFDVSPKEEARFHVSYDTLCEYEAEVIDADKLHEIAKKIKDGQKQEEAETIEGLKEEVEYLKSELSKTRDSLDSSRNNLRDKTQELGGLRKQLEAAKKNLLEKEAEIRELNSQVNALAKTGQELVDEVVDWGDRNLTALFRVLMPEEVDGAIKKMKVALKNVASIHDNSAKFLSDSPENNSFMGDGTGEKSSIKTG